MAYIDVLPLATVKNFLRLDAGQTEDDADITNMISAALNLIEIRTGHIAYSRNIDYENFGDNIIRIYDYPITAYVDPVSTDLVSNQARPGYRLIQVEGDVDTLTATVGYAADEFPTPLLEAAKQLIKEWYFGQDKEAATALIMSDNVKQILASWRRFIL